MDAERTTGQGTWAAARHPDHPQGQLRHVRPADERRLTGAREPSAEGTTPSSFAGSATRAPSSSASRTCTSWRRASRRSARSAARRSIPMIRVAARVARAAAPAPRSPRASRRWVGARTRVDRFAFRPRSAVSPGLRPTQGLVSRSGVMPLSHTQDIPGPLARTVTRSRDRARRHGRSRSADAATRVLDGRHVATISPTRCAHDCAYAARASEFSRTTSRMPTARFSTPCAPAIRAMKAAGADTVRRRHRRIRQPARRHERHQLRAQVRHDRLPGEHAGRAGQVDRRHSRGVVSRARHSRRDSSSPTVWARATTTPYQARAGASGRARARPHHRRSWTACDSTRSSTRRCAASRSFLATRSWDRHAR